MGKGSGRRPQQVSDKELEDSWDRIFKTTMKVRKENGKDKSDTTDTTKTKDRWLDNSSDC